MANSRHDRPVRWPVVIATMVARVVAGVVAGVTVLAGVCGPAFALQQSSADITEAISWPEFMSRHDLVWESLPDGWDAGAFLGNGLLGTMVYGRAKPDEDAARWPGYYTETPVAEHPVEDAFWFEVGRSDVTAGRLDDPRESNQRVPIGRFLLVPRGRIRSCTMRLDLWNAEARGKLFTTQGTIVWRSLVHADHLVTIIELVGSEGEKGCRLQWQPAVISVGRGRIRSTLPAEVKQEGNLQLCLHANHATAWREVETADKRRLYFISVGNDPRTRRDSCGDDRQDRSARREAVEAVQQALGTDLDQLVKSHRAWWHAFYPRAFLSIPDTRLESFYWIQIYKLATATRADRPVMDTLGPWSRQTAYPKIWWNLNTQLAYTPVYTGNRLELGESLLRSLNRHRASLIENADPKHCPESAALPHRSSYDLRDDGYVSRKEFGNLPWACHNYWRHYRMSMDKRMLHEDLFPIMKLGINFMLHHLERGSDGKWHMIQGYSPEYGEGPDCNYDLALLRWGCQTLVDTCQRLGIDDPLLPKWKEVLANLADYPTGPTGLLVARDMPLVRPHRHFSHLMMIYPLCTFTWDEPANRPLICTSVNHWLSWMGTEQQATQYAGYTYTAAACMSALMGDGDRALRYINILLDEKGRPSGKKMIRPNTLYVEHGPVIETPLHGAAALTDLFLLSHGDRIRVFPAVPSNWKDVVFHKLRAEGGFLVSAARKDGKTRFVRIESLAGEPCRLQTDLTDPIRTLCNRPVSVKKLADGTLAIGLSKGQAAILYSGSAPPDLSITPIPAERHRCNFYGLDANGQMRK